MEHKQEFDRLKLEIASELGIDLKPGYNGNISAKDAEKIGGLIGGNMVKMMISYAVENLNK